MLGSLGLLAVIFALVPGFIADVVYRACFGLVKGDQFERTLRAVVWSVLGLLVFAAVRGAPPNYVEAVLPNANAPPFNGRVGVDFALHIGCCSAVALVAGFVANSKYTEWVFSWAFGRSPTSRTPWDLMWAREAKGRQVIVLLKNGKTYAGYLHRASSEENEQELVLRDAGVLLEGANGFQPLVNARLVYIPKDAISEVHLTYTEEERASARQPDPKTVVGHVGHDAQNGAAGINGRTHVESPSVHAEGTATGVTAPGAADASRDGTSVVRGSSHA